MKFSAATLFVSLSQIAVLISAQQQEAASSSFLRKPESFAGDEPMSACNKQTNQASCFQTVDEASGLPCSWCVAGAIPSECVTQEQAAQLPEAVFECSTPGLTTFHFDTSDSVSHTFFSKTNDLCDAASKSLSGYMDIKGSDYDKNGQNKHLFYWMFEKRGDVDDTTPFIVSVVNYYVSKIPPNHIILVSFSITHFTAHLFFFYLRSG